MYVLINRGKWVVALNLSYIYILYHKFIPMLADEPKILPTIQHSITTHVLQDRQWKEEDKSDHIVEYELLSIKRVFGCKCNRFMGEKPKVNSSHFCIIHFVLIALEKGMKHSFSNYGLNSMTNWTLLP